MALPAFVATTGYLPEGLHLATETEVGEALGHANAQRQRLFGHLQRLLTAARGIQARRLFIDGSFVTDKESFQGDPPGDIDCVVWLPEHIDELIREAEPNATFLFGLHHIRKAGQLDLYYVFDEPGWDQWLAFFSSDDEGRPKGCVEVRL